jgi:tetrahydromethanopterin S-methyltransferase subunit B
MTEAEILEKINKKQNELEESRSRNASEERIKVLETEIEELLSSLSNQSTPLEKQQVYLDECAG